MSESSYTGLMCPKCLKPKAVIVAPLSASETALFFRCSGCGFQWAGPPPQPQQQQQEQQ